jgi:hypothetical protein
MATELQKKMILAIAEDEFTEFNGGIPECSDNTITWASQIIRTSQDKGVFTSLLNEELVLHAGEGRDAVVGLTDSGFKLYKEIKNEM